MTNKNEWKSIGHWGLVIGHLPLSHVLTQIADFLYPVESIVGPKIV